MPELRRKEIGADMSVLFQLATDAAQRREATGIAHGAILGAAFRKRPRKWLA